MQISEELPVGHLHYGKWTEDRRPKQFGTLTTLIPSGNADLNGFLKFFITQSCTEEAQRFTEKKYFKSLGTIVPEGFLIGKIIYEIFPLCLCG